MIADLAAAAPQTGTCEACGEFFDNLCKAHLYMPGDWCRHERIRGAEIFILSDEDDDPLKSFGLNVEFQKFEIEI